MKNQREPAKIIRKIVTVILIPALILVANLTFLSSCFTLLSLVTPEKNDNVFDQLYSELRRVKKGGDSVLINATPEARANYDFWIFEGVRIPELDMNIRYEEDTLYFFFWESDSQGRNEDITYKYRVNDNQLFGEDSVEYLTEHFLKYYFTWKTNAGEENPYSPGNLGNFRFELQEEVHFD